MYMAMVRTITVGFQGANKSIKEIEQSVPADWIPEDYGEAKDVLQLSQVKRALSVIGTVIYVKLSEPHDDGPLGMLLG